MKSTKDLSIMIIKVVAFATAFSALYQFVKDLGEIAVHIYSWFGAAISGCMFTILPLTRRK